MKLQPGTKLRQYQIAEPIGAGGMGEVYRAWDTNLERDVAVKVLPQDVAENQLHLARLQREAKSIATLSHPNVLAVFDFGIEDGTAFIVTELLEGESLRERLEAGAMPARKATEIGRQIARGLAAAHDKGIVHRDLKPDNIFLTETGRVKILDFGLATAGDGPDAPGDQTVKINATITNLTTPGTVLGTVDYMSPEQVRGQATDNRSDLFSFGSVLYEMVTGQRPFHRETPAETMTAILKEEPVELATLAADIPPALAAIIRRCLEKQAGERFHSAHDLAFSLEALSGSGVSTGTAEALAGVSGPKKRLPLALVGILILVGLGVGAGAAFLLRPVPTPDEQVTFLSLSSRRGTVTNARFTSNFESAVYSASWDGGPVRLYPATRGARTAEPLNMVAADLLSVASTGELAVALDRRLAVGWETIGTLAVAQPGGSAPRPILENVMAADWAPDGQTLAVAHEVEGAVRLEYPIGKVIYEAPGWISALRVSPDGNRVLIADCPDRGDNQAWVRVVDRDGTVQTLTRGGSWGVLWAANGVDVLFSGGSVIFKIQPGQEPRRVFASPVSIRLLDITPDGQVLAASNPVRREMITRAPGAQIETDISWLDWSTPLLISADGKLVVFEEGNESNREGYAIFMRGTDGTPPLPLGYGQTLGISPDATQVAVAKRQFQDDAELILVPTGLGTPRRLNLGGLQLMYRGVGWFGGENPGDPGGLLLPARQGDASPRVYLFSLDGNTPPRPVTPPDFLPSPLGHIVSENGKRMIVNPVEGTPVEFDLEGNGPLPVPGLVAGDLPLRFDRDGVNIYVQAWGLMPAPIYRVDTLTGTRTLWQELSPLDPAGVFQVDRVRVSADGSAYVYSNRRVTSTLVLIQGLY